MMSKMEHTDDGVYRHRRHSEQQQHIKSQRIIRHVLILLITTLTTIVLTSSCASANHYHNDVTNMFGSLHGGEPGQQKMVSITPNGEVNNVPVKIFLRLEDLVKVPCGMAKKTSVQLVNTHETEAVRILSIEVLSEGENPTYGKAFTSTTTTVDKALSGLNQLRGPDRSVFVSSFDATTLEPGETCIVDLEFIPRRFGGAPDILSRSSIDLHYRNGILLTLIMPSSGKTAMKTVSGEVIYDGQAVSFQVGGSAVANPLKLPEYILIRPRIDSQNKDYETHDTDEGCVEFWGDYGELPLQFGVFASDKTDAAIQAKYSCVNLTSDTNHNIYDDFFDAHISMKKERKKSRDLVPFLVWKWKNPFEEPVTTLSQFLFHRNIASQLIELKQKVKTGIVRWGELRLHFKTGEIFVIEIRLDLEKLLLQKIDTKTLILEGENAEINNLEQIKVLLNITEPSITVSSDFGKPEKIRQRALDRAAVRSDSGLFPVITATSVPTNKLQHQDGYTGFDRPTKEHVTEVIDVVDFGTIWAPYDDGSSSSDLNSAVTSDLAHVGIQNKDSIAVKVLRIEQIEYSFKSLESPLKKVSAHLLRAENQYLKIHTPTALNTIILSPKETEAKLIELSHFITPQSALLSGKIRITTNHLNEEFVYIHVSYKVRILRGHVDFDFDPNKNETSPAGSKRKDNAKPETSIWWGIPVSSSTLEWAHQATKRHPASLDVPHEQKPLSKLLQFRNMYPVPLQLNSIQLSDSCTGVARLWLLPAHPWANGTRYLVRTGNQSIDNHSDQIQAPLPDWGIIPGFGGVWLDFAEVEIFGEPAFPANVSSANISNNVTVGSGQPFICHLLLSNNLTSHALPIVMYDLSVRYSPRIRWDASTDQQPPLANDVISQTSTRFANVVRGSPTRLFGNGTLPGATASKEEEYSKTLKLGWELLHTLNHVRKPFPNNDKKVPLKNENHRTNYSRSHYDSGTESNSIVKLSATFPPEHLNIDVGSLHADGSFQTTSFYITNLNPVPIEIEARGHFNGMKLDMGSNVASIVDFLPKKVQNANHSFSDRKARDASKADRLNSTSISKTRELNFDFITSSKTSVLAKLRRQHDVSFSPMLWTNPIQNEMPSLETTSISQAWEGLYNYHKVVTLFRSLASNQTQDHLHMAESMILWEDFCKQNREDQDGIKECNDLSSPLSYFFKSRSRDSLPYGCLLSADDGQIFVLKPLKPSGDEKTRVASETHSQTRASWLIPPGAVARIEMTIRAPHHSLLSTDVSRFFGFGLGLFNKATQHEIPVVVSYHAIRGHLLLRESHSFTDNANKNLSRIHVPCLLFSSAVRNDDNSFSSIHKVPQKSYLSAPLEMVSTFSYPVRLVSARSTCTSLFQFDSFIQDIAPGSSGVNVGHVALHLPCNVAGDEQSMAFNFYSCAHSWLQLRYRTISCKNADMRHGEKNIAASETEAVTRALRLSEDLMQLMNKRFGEFYKKLQNRLGNTTPIDHTDKSDESSEERHVTDSDFAHIENSLIIPTTEYMDSSLRATRSTVVSDYNSLALSDIVPTGLDFDRAPSSPSVLTPSIRVPVGTRPPALIELLLKINVFDRLWDQGIELFNWNTIDDEVEIKVAVLQEEQQLDEEIHGDKQKPSAWKEVLIRAASSPSNSSTGMEADTAMLHSTISLSRISTASSLQFLYSRKKQDNHAEVTPVTFVSRGYVIVRNPAAVPIKVRLTIAENDSHIVRSWRNQDNTTHEAQKHEDKEFEKTFSTLYVQPVNSINMLGPAERLDVNAPYNSRSPPSKASFASTHSWWNGGSYFLYSQVSNRLLQASHNITIRSAGGTHVSLINPSMQAVNALSVGCGKRCGLRHELITTERSEAPLGAIASRNVDWVKKGSALSTSHPAAFALALSAQVEKVIPPLTSVKLGPIMFRPPARGEFSGSVILENSLSGAELIDLVGVGGVEELRLESWRLEDDTVSYEQYVPPFRSTVSLNLRSRKNPYTIGVSNIENRYNHPTLVFSGGSNPHTHASFVKTVHVTNSGDVPISVERVYLGSSELVYHTKLRPHPEDFQWLASHAKEGCEYSGFRILGCITDAEEKTRADKFRKGFFASVRRWFIGKDIVNMYNALPENSKNIAQGFHLLPGESIQIHIAHVADCSFQKMYATLHLQYMGRSSTSLDHEAKAWRQAFQSHEETLLVGYEMTSTELLNECRIAKPRAQGMIFSKSGRDPIGMHVRGEYPIAYYAIDSLFNWMARRYSVGSSNVPADYAYLFVYTASMFVEHSTVALLVSIVFLLFFHALIFLVDRTSQSKAFRDMWRDNIALRESTKAGWRTMLLLGRTYSDAHLANVETLQQAARDVVKAGTINSLKPIVTSGGGMPLACIAPDGGFVVRVCPNNASGSTMSKKDGKCHATDQRSNLSRTQQQTLSDAIFWQLEGKAFVELLPAGLGWHPAASAAPDVFYDMSDSYKHETRNSRVSQLLQKRESEAESSKFEERDVEIEISFNDDDDHSILELESEDEFDQLGRQEGSSSEMDESIGTEDSGEDEGDLGIGANLIHEDGFQEQHDLASPNMVDWTRRGTVSSTELSASTPSWYVQRINSRKTFASNGNRDFEVIAVGGPIETVQESIDTNNLGSSIQRHTEGEIHPSREEQFSTSLSPKNDGGRRAEISTIKGVEAAVTKRRVVTSRVAMSLEKRAAAKGAPVNAWRTTNVPPNQGLPSQPIAAQRQQQPCANNSKSSESSLESHLESPLLAGSLLHSYPQLKNVLAPSEAELSSPYNRGLMLHGSREYMKSVIPPLPLVPTPKSLDDEVASPSPKHADYKRISTRAPPGLAPPPGFESSPLASKTKIVEGIGESDVINDVIAHSRVGTLTSDPWASVGVDLIQSFPLGPLSLVRASSEPSQHHNIGSSLSVSDARRNESLTASPVVISVSDIMGHISNASQASDKLSETSASLGNMPLQVVGGGLADLGLNHYSSMGLFNVETFLGFLYEDDNQDYTSNAEEELHSYSSPLLSFRKSEHMAYETDVLSADEIMKDLWDPSSGEIISPRARASVASAIGGERGTGSGPSTSPSGWMKHRDDARPITGLGSGLLTPEDLLKSSSEDGIDVPATKRNAFFANWMSEASEEI